VPPGPPVEVAEPRARRPLRVSPALGENTAEVMQELGLTA